MLESISMVQGIWPSRSNYKVKRSNKVYLELELEYPFINALSERSEDND